WPPPVTTATQPSNLGKDCLLQNRAQRLDQPRTFLARRRRGIAEIGPRPAGRLERALSLLDCAGEGLRIRDEADPRSFAHGGWAFAQENRALELARVARSTLELIAEPRTPRPARQVGKYDRQ